MAVTNTDEKVADDDAKVTEDDLRKAKYGEDDVETSQEADEASESESTAEESEETSEEAGQTDQSQTEETEETDETESAEESPDFVKEFPQIKGDTLEDYARSLEEAYKNSTTEALRLKKIADTSTDEKATTETETESGPIDPRLLYLDQMLNKDIKDSFVEFSRQYPQVKDPAEYDKFETEAAALSKYIIETQKRVAPASELYSKVAVILGWQPDDKVDSKDKLGIALKGQAAVAKTSSTVKPVKKSKVTDAMIAANRLMYPNKTDAEIVKELEPFVK